MASISQDRLREMEDEMDRFELEILSTKIPAAPESPVATESQVTDSAPKVIIGSATYNQAQARIDGNNSSAAGSDNIAEKSVPGGAGSQNSYVIKPPPPPPAAPSFIPHQIRQRPMPPPRPPPPPRPMTGPPRMPMGMMPPPPPPPFQMFGGGMSSGPGSSQNNYGPGPMNMSSYNNGYMPQGMMSSGPMMQQSNPMMHQPNPMMQHSNHMMQQSNPMMQQSNPMMSQANPMMQQSNPMMQQSNPMMQQSNPMMQQSFNSATISTSAALIEKPRVVYSAAPVKRVAPTDGTADGATDAKKSKKDKLAQKQAAAAAKKQNPESSTASAGPSQTITSGNIELNVPVTAIETEKRMKQMTAGAGPSSATGEVVTGQASAEGTKKEKKEKKKKFVRMAAGTVWEDLTLGDWDPDDFRVFCGDLGNEVTDDTLARAFNKYPSFRKAKVVRDKRTMKTKGFGFVSFKDPNDFVRAIREMNGKYVGNRPIKLRKSCWQDRQIDSVKKKEKEKKKLGFK